MKVLEKLTSFFAWLQIVASPLCIGLIAGFVVYRIYPTHTGLIAGIAMAALELTAGIIFAARVTKKRGAVDVISRVSASPELDNAEDEKEY